MNLKAKLFDRYSIKVVDVDHEKKILNYKIDTLSISKEDYERLLTELNELLPFYEEEPPVTEELNSLKPFYIIENGAIYQKWEIINNDPHLIKIQINELKKELESSDYKIIKSYEASLTNNPIVYNLDELHNMRQELRDRINYLEKML